MNRSPLFVIIVVAAAGVALVLLSSRSATAEYRTGGRIAANAQGITPAAADSRAAISLGDSLAPTAGGNIAFLSERGAGPGHSGAGDIYVMNTDGSGVTRIFTNPYPVYHPALSPDGTKIAFNFQGDVHVINVDGSRLVNLSGPTDGNEVAWSPDGQKIAFQGYLGSSDIFVVNADGTGLTNLTNTPNPYINERQPAWSPDGSKIVYSSDQEEDTFDFDIWVMNADGSGQTQLTFNNFREESPAWSPIGNQIAYSALDGWTDIMVMNADGSGQRQVTDSRYGDNTPAWSPDGSKIVFESYRNWNDEDEYDSDIYVMNADGSGVVNLTNDPYPDASPTWSPAPIVPHYSIAGHVTDDSDNPIFGVTVTAVGPVTRTTTTSNSGYYELGDLPPGAYMVTPSLSQHAFSPPTVPISVPNDGSLVSFVATPATIFFDLVSLPPPRFYPISEQKILKLAVRFDGAPARGFIYRLEDGNEQALGFTDNGGILYTTIDRDQSPLLGSYSPTFRAVLGNGLRIDVVFPYTVTAYSPDQWVLDEAGVTAVNRLTEARNTPNMVDLIPELHYGGGHPQLSLAMQIVGFIQNVPAFLEYMPRVGDVIVTYQYRYAPDDPSLPTVTRWDEHINRGGNIVSQGTWWADSGGYYVASVGWVQVGVLSPARLSLTDPQGRRTGVDLNTGQLVNEIPDSVYIGPDTEPQLILVFRPINGVYNSAAVGTGSGTVHFDTWSIPRLGSTQQESITAPIVPGQLITQDVNYRDGEKIFLSTVIRN